MDIAYTLARPTQHRRARVTINCNLHIQPAFLASLPLPPRVGTNQLVGSAPGDPCRRVASRRSEASIRSLLTSSVEQMHLNISKASGAVHTLHDACDIVQVAGGHWRRQI